MSGAGLFLLLAVLAPALLAGGAAFAAARRPVALLLPWAAVPALLSALAGGGAQIALPEVLFGAGLALDGTGRAFLGLTALIWIAAGAFARSYMAGSGRGNRFNALWLLTLTGNLGLTVAADVVAFYLFFSLMTFAAYGLVIHDGSAGAIRAGRVYMILAVAGETAMLLAFMLAANAAGSLRIAEVAAGAAASPWPGLTLALLIAGFGVKAGLVPLHVWLPLAHPAAPTPASAVLSGAIVKAGILGLLRFLPLDAGLPGWGGVLLAAGLFTAWYGILAGLPQRHPKTVLAYSSLSQMGLVVAGLGAALAAPAAMPAVAFAVIVYAASHGLTKAALFLGTGVAEAAGRRHSGWILLLLGLAGLAIAGAPLTGGALAKTLLAGLLGDGAAAAIASASALGTTLLMARFLWVLRRRLETGGRRPAPGLALPWLALLLAAAVVPWGLWLYAGGGSFAEMARPAALWKAGWAPLLGIVIAAAVLLLARRLPGLRSPGLPESDLVVPLERGCARLLAAMSGRRRRVRHRRRPRPLRLASRLADRFDRELRRQPHAEMAAIAGALVFALAFAAALAGMP